MSVKEKRRESIGILDDLPKSTFDHVLRLLEEEGRVLSEISEDAIKGLEGNGIKLPLGRKNPKIRQTPLKLKGKPLSEMIIEDRR